MIKHEGFTPGPWHIAGKTAYHEVWSAHHMIGYICCNGSTFKNPEGLANATLIADAPRLYADNQRLAQERDAYLRELSAWKEAISDGCSPTQIKWLTNRASRLLKAVRSSEAGLNEEGGK